MKLTLASLAALALATAARANGPCPTAPVEPEVGAAALLGQMTYQSTASYGTTTGGGCCGTVPAPGMVPGPVYTPPCAGAALAPSYAPAYAPSYAPSYAPAYAGYSRGLAFAPSYGYSRSFAPALALAPSYGYAAVPTFAALAFAPAVVVRAPVVRVRVGHVGHVPHVPPVVVPGGGHGHFRVRGRF